MTFNLFLENRENQLRVFYTLKINVTSTLLKVSNPTKPQTPTYFLVFALQKYFVKLPFLLSLFCRNCQDQLRCAHCIFFLSLFSTEGFSPSQNIIVKPWVYMSFFIIHVYFHALLLVQNRSLLCVFLILKSVQRHLEVL